MNRWAINKWLRLSLKTYRSFKIVFPAMLLLRRCSRRLMVSDLRPTLLVISKTRSLETYRLAMNNSVSSALFLEIIRTRSRFYSLKYLRSWRSPKERWALICLMRISKRSRTCSWLICRPFHPLIPPPRSPLKHSLPLQNVNKMLRVDFPDLINKSSWRFYKSGKSSSLTKRDRTRLSVRPRRQQTPEISSKSLRFSLRIKWTRVPSTKSWTVSKRVSWKSRRPWVSKRINRIEWSKTSPRRMNAFKIKLWL